MLVDAAVATEVVRRQQQRLAEATLLPGAAEPVVRSRWAHVPLPELFRADGNAISERSRGLIETGHEPHHSSKRGRCVLINTASGFWLCRSCRRAGDASTYVMLKHGITYVEAAVRLTTEYGPPTDVRTRGRRGKPRQRVEVVTYGR